MSKTVKDVAKYVDDEEEILEKKKQNKELREKRRIRTIHIPEDEDADTKEIERITPLRS